MSPLIDFPTLGDNEEKSNLQWPAVEDIFDAEMNMSDHPVVVV